MSEINPENYEGASVTLVGRAGGEARSPAYDKDGRKGILELSIAVGQGYKKDGEWVDTGTTWYNYTAVGDYADALRAVNKGDKVRIDNAKLETREFTRKDQSVGQSFDVKYGTLTVLESKAREGGTVADAGFLPADTGGGF